MSAEGQTLDLNVTETVYYFIEAAATGRMPVEHDLAWCAEPIAPLGQTVDELLLVGPRGEGKTWGVLTAILRHATYHEQAGFPLPVPWLWFRDNFPNCERNVLQDVQRPEWKGVWQLQDGGRTVTCRLRKHEVIRAFVVGLEDKDAIERLRTRVVGIYGEEPAPAVGFALGTGWTEAAWALALSSQGIPSHYHPALLASNYPEKTHWSWQRFVAKRQPQCGFFRIRPGERVTQEERRRLERVTAGQETMARRLFVGEPAPAVMGHPVVQGFREKSHQRYGKLTVAPGPLLFGWDFWHHPAVTVASMTPMGQLRFHFAQRLDGADVGILVDEVVKPWLTQAGLMDRPRLHTGDPTGDQGDQSDLAMSAVRRLRKILPGEWHPATNSIDKLAGAVNDQLRRTLTTGDPAILIGAEASELGDAWAGGWHVNDMGKPVQRGEEGRHSHVGMAGAYVVFYAYGVGAKGDMSAWANQDAYTQPWHGSMERQPSPARRSPSMDTPPWATEPVRSPGTFDPELWRKANR